MTSVSHIGLVALVGLVAAGVACDGAGPDPAPPPDRTVSARLTAGRSAGDAEARAAVFAAEAARYRRLAEESRTAAAALTLDIARQAQIATEIQAPATADPLPREGTVDREAIAPASVR